MDAIDKWISRLPKPGGKTRLMQFVLAFLVLAGAALLIVRSYREIDRELTDAALSRRASVAYLAAATLSEKFDHLTDLGVALSGRVLLPKLIRAGRWVEASEVLKNVLEDFPFIERLFLADPAGNLMADVPELPGVRGKNFADRDWYQGVSRRWEPYVSAVYKRAAAPQLNVFAAAVPIKDADRETLGILVLQVRLDAFFAWIAAAEAERDTIVYVVDRNGQIAFHPRFPPQGQIVDFSAAPAVQRVLQGKREVEITFNPIEGERRVSAYAPIAKHGWGVVAAQPVSSAFAAKDDHLTRLLIAYALILLLCVSVAYLVLRMVFQHRQAAQDRAVKAELEQRVEERTRAEAALRESNALLNGMFESAPDAILLVGADGRIMRANSEAGRMFGYGLEGIAGKPVDDLIPRRYRDSHMRHRLGYAAQPRLRAMGSGMELYALRSDGGEFPVAITLGPLRADGSLTVICIVRDITERKRADDEIRRLNAELEQRVEERTVQLSTANRDLEAFSYSISHDLRAPLRAISGFAQILARRHRGNLNEEARHHLDNVVEASEHMSRLIDDLLNYARLGRRAVNLQPVALPELLAQVAKNLAPRVAEYGAELVIPRELPAIASDPTLLVQVLGNLIDNALMYHRPEVPPRVELGCGSAAGRVTLTVTDNGIGIPAEYFDRIFQTFQRLHTQDQYPGTGIGLAIVKKAVEMLDGRVWVESAVGAGSRFFVELPLQSAEGRSRDAESPAASG